MSDDTETGNLLVAYAQNTIKSRMLRKEIAAITDGLKMLVQCLEENPASLTIRNDTFCMPLRRKRVPFDQLSDLAEKVSDLSMVEKDLDCAKKQLKGNPLWRAFQPEESE